MDLICVFKVGTSRKSPLFIQSWSKEFITKYMYDFEDELDRISINGNYFDYNDYKVLSLPDNKSLNQSISEAFKEGKIFNKQFSVTDLDGTTFSYKDGVLHSDCEPAFIREGVFKKWYLNGKLHREGSPAVEWKNGAKEWWVNDKLHREDGPAMEYRDGHKAWHLNGRWCQNIKSQEEFIVYKKLQLLK